MGALIPSELSGKFWDCKHSQRPDTSYQLRGEGEGGRGGGEGEGGRGGGEGEGGRGGEGGGGERGERGRGERGEGLG